MSYHGTNLWGGILPPELVARLDGILNLNEAGITDTEHGNRTGGTLHSNAVNGVSAGFMSATDKTTLDALGAVVSGFTTSTFTATTKYLSAPGTTLSATQVALAVVTHTGIIRNLRANLGTAPGGSDTVAFTVQKSSDNGGTWSDTTLTCTISAAAKAASDTTDKPAVTAGDLLAIKTVSSGTTAATAAASFEVV